MTGQLRALSSSETRWTEIISRMFPRWIGPEGLIPDWQTIVAPSPLVSRTFASTASAILSVQWSSFAIIVTGVRRRDLYSLRRLLVDSMTSWLPGLTE